MATKIYIDGNFLIAEDSITRAIYFKVQTAGAFHYRSNDVDNIYAFFLSDSTPRIEGYIKFIQLGRQEQWDFNEPDPNSKTNFEFSDIVDGDGIAYADSDIFDKFLNDELGFHKVSHPGSVNSVTGLNTDNTDPSNPIVKISVDGVTITGQGTPADPLVASGPGGTILRNVSSTDTFATASETINCTSGTFTVNLPTAVGIQGIPFTLVNSGTGIITLDPNGTETINGSLTIDIKRNQLSRTVQSDGSNWIII